MTSDEVRELADRMQPREGLIAWEDGRAAADALRRLADGIDACDKDRDHLAANPALAERARLRRILTGA